MIIIFGGNKCSGKSTTLSNCVFPLAENQKTCIADADKQQSITKWYKRREKNKFKINFDLINIRGNIAQTLLDLDSKFDLVLVDVAGVNSEEFISALTVADLAIITLEPTIKVLETLDELAIQQKQISKVNKLIKFRFTQVRTKISFSSKNRRDFFLSHCVKFGFGKPFDSVIFERESFFKIDEVGGTVFETKDKNAQQEILSLTKEIVKTCNE